MNASQNNSCTNNAQVFQASTSRMLVMDPDLKAVMEYMQSRMPASKLVGVSQALAEVATVMWGHYEREQVRALALEFPAINAGQQLQATSI